MILEKYVCGQGWHIVGVEDYDDTEAAIAWARDVVTSRRVAPGTFRLVVLDGAGATAKRSTVEAFDVTYEGQVYR